MAKMNEKKDGIQQVVPEEPKDKSVITSEDVEEVVSGDEIALSAQMERIKNLTKEQQIEAIEAEKRRRLELEKKKQLEMIENQKKTLEDEKLREKRQQEALLLAQKKAQEENLKKQQELELQKEQQQLLLKQEEEKRRLEQQKIANQQSINVQNNSQPPLNSTSSVDNNANITKKESEPNKFKTILAVFLFISLMAMIYFLPEITSYFNERKNNQIKITSGILKCNLKKNNENLDIDIETLFYFANNELYKMSYTTAYTGDKNDDKEELSSKYNECLVLKKEAGELEGVTISCTLNSGISSNKQILDYEKLDVKKVSSAYTEAGGIYPAEFKKSENIDKIESDMVSNKYVCSRS